MSAAIESQDQHHKLANEHAQTLNRLYDAIAEERGLGEFSALTHDLREDVIAEANGLCERWRARPDWRNEPATTRSITERLVAEEYEIERQIARIALN